MLQKVERRLRRQRRGTAGRYVQEVYLRDDIGCGSLLCDDCEYSFDTRATLCGSSVVHGDSRKILYLIPDFVTLCNQLDLLTNPEFHESKDCVINIILLASIVDELKQRRKKIYLRIFRELIDCSKQYGMLIYVFGNNNHRECYIQRKNGETLDEHRFDQICKVYQWYYRHLKIQRQRNVDLILLSNNKNSSLSILSMTCLQLIERYFSKENIENMKDLLSVVIETRDEKENSGLLFKKHWNDNKVESHLNKKLIYRGKYQCIRAYGNNAHGFVRGTDGDEKISINGLSNINRAIHEDIVAVELVNKDKEGRIVSILQRNWRPYCGSIDESSSVGRVLFLPIDGRIPKILINTKQIGKLMNQRIVVTIDDWKMSSRYPFGHYTQSIGEIGNLEVETQVLLLEHDIPYDPWSDAVLSCLPKTNDITQSDMASCNRVDLREKRIVFSVDPPGCTDIDDALHCHEMDNGLLECGVHIADVGYYVESDSALDKEALKRGTSVYLVDRRIDMLPNLLSTDMCSLVANRDRLAFSVIWEMEIDKENLKYSIKNVRFHRSIICSKAALAYKEAQKIIDDKNNNTLIGKALKNLIIVSRCLKNERLLKGALSLSSPQPKFSLDKKDKNPSSLKPYEMVEANSMIEEFMLLANITVAKQILSHLPHCSMLRRHPTPSTTMLQKLVKCGEILNFDIKIENSAVLSKSLDMIGKGKRKNNEKNDNNDNNDNNNDGKDLNEIIRMIATRCMTQAIYFASGNVNDSNLFHHYGLASPIYTHFTSPIRRYADIVVHRQLANSIGISNLTQTFKDKEKMNSICDNINRRHRLAQYIGRASNNLYTLMYFDGREEYTHAIITNVDRTCIDVYAPKFCLERRVYIVNNNNNNSNNKDSSNVWKFDANKLILKRNVVPAVKYQIFDKINVKISVHTSKMHRKKLIVDIIDANLKKNSGVVDSSSIVDNELFEGD